MLEEITDEQLVARYIQLRTAKSARVKEQEAEIEANFNAHMTAIAQLMLMRLNERGANNTKTDAGTAYKKRSVSATVDNRDKFLNYVIEHSAWALLTNHVSKEQVEAIVELTGSPPDGVKISEAVVVNFKKG